MNFRWPAVIVGHWDCFLEREKRTVIGTYSFATVEVHSIVSLSSHKITVPKKTENVGFLTFLYIRRFYHVGGNHRKLMEVEFSIGRMLNNLHALLHETHWKHSKLHCRGQWRSDFSMGAWLPWPTRNFPATAYGLWAFRSQVLFLRLWSTFTSCFQAGPDEATGEVVGLNDGSGIGNLFNVYCCLI